MSHRAAADNADTAADVTPEQTVDVDVDDRNEDEDENEDDNDGNEDDATATTTVGNGPGTVNDANSHNHRNDRVRTIFRAVVARWDEESATADGDAGGGTHGANGIGRETKAAAAAAVRSHGYVDTSVWGEPSWGPDENLIVPPHWDSEGKVRAVLDAHGDSFERDVEPLLSSRHSSTSALDSERQGDKDVQKQGQQQVGPEAVQTNNNNNKQGATTTKMTAVAGDWLKKHAVWVDRLGSMADLKENHRPTNSNSNNTGGSTGYDAGNARRTDAKAGSGGGDIGSGGKEDGGVQANFFERLLLSAAAKRP